MELDPKTPEEQELEDAGDDEVDERDEPQPWAKTSSGDADEVTQD